MSTWRILAAAAVAGILGTVEASAEGYLTAEQVRRLAIAMPKPEYPESERHRGIEGIGIFKLYVHAKTGRLTSVKILHSTQNRALDAAAIWALLQWRFKPGALRTIREVYPPSKEPNADQDACVCVPISFLTRAGAQVR